MSQGPNVSMGGGSFDFDRENRGPQRPGGPGGPNSGGSGRKPRRIGCGTIITIVIVLIVLGNVFRGCGSSAEANCGDYDLNNGQYVSNPGKGDYEKNGSSYDYVGCDTSRSGGGGGFFFLPFFTGGGSNYGDGSGFRGGGPGTGK
ncbi:hypothetical protein [Brevibacterium spongiae]|uniref:Uncharacterized protein n=1 Tax=Brevibacterium spongiae TaxID=2909672 RepID=A0ABY5SV92_9MICO|nr:hypothetical protein [Brevibacterium spongiae]UVI36999.1 hypothetical protein L1F31_04915 [Brevibacterium spongiae]